MKIARMNIATKIINFIKDERGAESVEFGIVTVTIAAGAAAGLTATKNQMQQKQADTLSAINVDPS